ncbi:PEP-CTERM sorting domain-containing protein [Marinobacter sp. BSs20148]|uniref:PEP-CTERM sorting domain-containing protein n=1 Tax=Marinobacter sp. BSs20148 TaxID=490759 RepID=UPI000A0795F9
MNLFLNRYLSTVIGRTPRRSHVTKVEPFFSNRLTKYGCSQSDSAEGSWDWSAPAPAPAPVPVPEPASFALVAIGIMGLALRRFEKQS